MLNSAFLGTHINLFKEKSFQLYFKKNIMQSILLYSMVLSWWGRRSTYMRRNAGEEGGANFLLKCHALCPICLTFLVVHFYMHIYVSLLKIWENINFSQLYVWHLPREFANSMVNLNMASELAVFWEMAMGGGWVMVLDQSVGRYTLFCADRSSRQQESVLSKALF